MINSTKRLVFVGGGHVHLYSLKFAEKFIEQNIDITVISPDRFHYYSGMGPGMLSRIYEPEQLRFDVQKTVGSKGGRFLKGKVTSIDAENKTVFLDGGEKIDYDVVSFNVGSRVPLHLIEGANDNAFPVKPIEALERLRNTVLEEMEKGIPRVLVVGGGPAGVELAGNLWRLVWENQGKAEIILLNSQEKLLPNITPKAGRLAEQSLSKRGIRIVPNFYAASLNNGLARSRSGEEIAFDVAVMAIGTEAPDIFQKSGLKTAKDGAFFVNDYLQSIDSPEIFGGGDCIAVEGKKVDRVGVYAVREAPILFQNLQNSLQGKPLERFEPQEKYLLIFNMGDGSGIFVRGSFVWQGKLAFTFKNYLDTSFVSRFKIV